MRKIKGKNINFKMLYYIKKDCSTTKILNVVLHKKLLFNINKIQYKSDPNVTKKSEKIGNKSQQKPTKKCELSSVKNRKKSERKNKFL